MPVLSSIASPTGLALQLSPCSSRTLRTFPKEARGLWRRLRHRWRLPARGGGASEAPPYIPPAYVPPWPYGQGARRPPFLLSRPEPIAVVAEVPDGPPVRFVWRRVERRVARRRGRSVIAPEWWRAIGLNPALPAGSPQGSRKKRSVRARDYYEIEDEAGAAFTGCSGTASTAGEEESRRTSAALVRAWDVRMSVRAKARRRAGRPAPSVLLDASGVVSAKMRRLR